MKKAVLLSLYLSLLAAPVCAQMPYIEEVKALGAIAGQGMACGSSKYDTFEMLARAILLTKAPNNKLMNDAIYAYNEEKANAYVSKQMDGFYECPLILQRFDNQEIFNITLYADGTLKMPNGKIITPQTPYDATQIYQKNDETLIKAQKIYDNAVDKKKAANIKPVITSIKPEARPRYEQALTGAPAAPVAAPAPASAAPKAPAAPNIKHISRKY